MHFPKPSQILPHRPPMLLIDEIIDHKQGKSLTVRKRIEADSIHFQGHFPENPIFPGVMQIEMMFQAAGIMVRLEQDENTTKQGRAIKVEEAVFKKEVLPNDELTIKVEPVSSVKGFHKYKAVIKNQQDNLVAKGVVVVLVG